MQFIVNCYYIPCKSKILKKNFKHPLYLDICQYQYNLMNINYFNSIFNLLDKILYMSFINHFIYLYNHCLFIHMLIRIIIQLYSQFHYLQINYKMKYSNICWCYFLILMNNIMLGILYNKLFIINYRNRYYNLLNIIIYYFQIHNKQFLMDSFISIYNYQYYLLIHRMDSLFHFFIMMKFLHIYFLILMYNMYSLERICYYISSYIINQYIMSLLNMLYYIHIHLLQI